MSHNGTHYSMQKITEAKRSMEISIELLPKLRERLEGNKHKKSLAKNIYGDILSQFKDLHKAISLSILALHEMGETEQAGYASKLRDSVKDFNPLTPDYSKLCTVINSYVDSLPDIETKANAAIIARLMNNVRMGFYPTDLAHIGYIENGIEFPDGITTNLFDPCCGGGHALRALAEGNNCFAYGVEIDRERAEDALTRLHRVGFGSYFHSRISTKAFHAMLLNPPYLSLISDGLSRIRSEKKFIVESYDRLMIGGLLIYIIPYYRLTPDISRVICDNFTDITVWKFCDDEFAKFNQIAILGTRCNRIDGSLLAAKLADMACMPDKMPQLSRLPQDRYKLPALSSDVELFKGAEFNVAELKEQLKRSGSLKKIYSHKILEQKALNPPLPFKIGQVGLIGGSGYINGFIDCEIPHILKGRVVRENSIKEEFDGGKTVITEITSNHMNFNILTSEGIKRLNY